MRVCDICPVEECWERTGKDPIKTKWVDTNKTNDTSNPNYRSRLVAREFKTTERLDLYRSTPPVEWMRAIVAKVAESQGNRERWTENYERKHGHDPVTILYSDISRAYFNAKAPRDKYSEVP